jgi:hypothetical protein
MRSPWSAHGSGSPGGHAGDRLRRRPSSWSTSRRRACEAASATACAMNPSRAEAAGDEAFLWLRERRRRRCFVIAGHYDTVPAQERPGPHRGRIHGCDASDVKGGVAVALELVRELASRDPGWSTSCYPAVKAAAGYDPLPAFSTARAVPVALQCCSTNKHRDRPGASAASRPSPSRASGHSARPWPGQRAAPSDRGPRPVANHKRRDIVVDGLPFTEVVGASSPAACRQRVPPLRRCPHRLPRRPPRTPSIVAARSTVDGRGGRRSAAGAVSSARRLCGPATGGSCCPSSGTPTASGILRVNYEPGATRSRARVERVEISSS